MTGSEPAQSIGRYRLGARLPGRGVESRYAAYDTHLRRYVVLQTVPEADAPRSMLARARAVGRLDHPNIARVHDVGVAADPEGAPVVFIAVEHVRNAMTLQAWADQDRAEVDVARRLDAVAAALEAAHAHDVVHGALEASRVLCNAAGRVLVIDFENAAATPFDDQRAWAALWGSLAATPSRRVAAVLARARAQDVATQFPSMTALRDALREAMRPRRGGWMVAGVGVALLGGWTLAPTAEAAVPCATQVAGQADAVWSTGRAQRVQAGLAGSGSSQAEVTTAHLLPRIDDYVERWRGGATDACEVKRTAADARFDPRSLCYEQALADVDALLELLEGADAKAADRAITAATRLPDLATCDRGVRVGAIPLVIGATGQGSRQLAWIKALQRTGRDDDAFAAATELLRERDLSASVRCAVHRVRAQAFQRGRDYAAAAEEAKASYNLAVASDLNEAAVRAAALLVSIEGNETRDYTEAEAWLRRAEAGASRPDADPLLQAVVDQHAANFAYGRGQYPEALQRADAAIAVRSRIQGPEHDMVYAVRNNRAAVLRTLGRWEEAVAELRSLLAYQERTYGRMNSIVARSYNNIGSALTDAGSFSEALEPLGQAIEIWTVTKGPRYADLGMAHTNLGNAHAQLDHEALAVTHYEAAIDVWSEAFGADNFRVGIVHNNYAAAMLTALRYAEARREAQTAYDIQVTNMGSDHPDLVYACTNLSLANLRLGDTAAARRWADEGLRLVEGKAEALPAETTKALKMAAEVRLYEARAPDADDDRRTQAVTELTQACAALDALPEPIDRRAHCHMLRADALWEFGRSGAKAAAAKALALIDAAGLDRDGFDEARTRLAARAAPPRK
ncbi:MAG: protein kinase family protein [Myxococcota bacterium]